MVRTISFMGGLGLGAGLMYVLDPERGHRRRAQLRNQLTHGLHEAEDALAAARTDLRHRARGWVARARRMLAPDHTDDEILVERVRAKLGRLVSHPHNIQVTARDGIVELAGPVLADGVDRLLAGVASVRGVRAIVNQLEVYPDPAAVPALQSDPRARRPAQSGFDSLPPATKLLVGLSGLLLVAGAPRRGAGRSIARTLGLALTARSMGSLLAHRRPTAEDRIVLHKTLSIDAPVEEVFDLFSRFEHLPRFMAQLREVRPLGNGRMHWVAAGPAGVPLEWDAVVTRRIPNRRIEWESIPGSGLEVGGTVQFEPCTDGTTRLDLQLRFRPPDGPFAHLIARLLGVQAKRALEKDLIRFKSLLENGKTRIHGQLVTLQELECSRGSGLPS